ncbi:YceK/YidQ family lipoprotein [Mixta theicola]|uniref:YceK/YidQ family lipoprotein n=1 Tax=Mixta theicola TaxID=1458355 RepID=A0A2K1Q873_9GAMM|nr:YceK/YidQ family lipoprotein [Mixta theicola]PNS11235.1 YceK/YidQ family lipoprotein [Mixta theicola]
MKAIKKYRLAGLLACSALAGTSGCSSMMSHTGASQGYYPGTRASAEILTDDQSSWALKPLALVDLPFSAVLDTVLLPWDYMRAGDSQSIDSPRARVIEAEKLARTQENLAEAAPLAINSPQP